MTLASLNGLMHATQTEVELTSAASALLSRKSVILRKIPASTFRALFPIVPREILEGLPVDLPAAEFNARLRERELAWLETAPGAERRRYRVELEAVKFAALAIALVEPRMTEDEVERLGDEAAPLYLRLLAFSNLIEERKPEPETQAVGEDAAA
jgi:hypothetical protein